MDTIREVSEFTHDTTYIYTNTMVEKCTVIIVCMFGNKEWVLFITVPKEKIESFTQVKTGTGIKGPE